MSSSSSSSSLRPDDIADATRETTTKTTTRESSSPRDGTRDSLDGVTAVPAEGRNGNAIEHLDEG